MTLVELQKVIETMIARLGEKNVKPSDVKVEMSLLKRDINMQLFTVGVSKIGLAERENNAHCCILFPPIDLLDKTYLKDNENE